FPTKRILPIHRTSSRPFVFLSPCPNPQQRTDRTSPHHRTASIRPSRGGIVLTPGGRGLSIQKVRIDPPHQGRHSVAPSFTAGYSKPAAHPPSGRRRAFGKEQPPLARLRKQQTAVGAPSKSTERPPAPKPLSLPFRPTPSGPFPNFKIFYPPFLSYACR